MQMIGYIAMIGLFISMIGLITQYATKKGDTKVWIIAVIIFLVLFIVRFGFSNLPSDTKELESTPSPQPQTEELSDVEKFAKDNNISVALAESIKYALEQTGYDLNAAYNMEQLDDWAEGQRYKIWVSMEYEWIFYVKNDEVQSIRQQKGLTYIWQKE